jgi:TPR repeat protein
MILSMKYLTQSFLTALIGLLALSSAHAGMTPAEVKAFKDEMTKAEKGDATAQANLGWYYRAGQGVAKDPVQAAKWYRKAAEQGDASAQHNMGACYFYGAGVAKDLVQAASWYRKAADQGDASSQNILGMCYFYGDGLAKNEIEAYAYWSIAGKTNADARKNLSMLKKQMSSGKIATGQKRVKELQKEIDAKIAAKPPEDVKKAGK